MGISKGVSKLHKKFIWKIKEERKEVSEKMVVEAVVVSCIKSQNHGNIFVWDMNTHTHTQMEKWRFPM